MALWALWRILLSSPACTAGHHELLGRTLLGALTNICTFHLIWVHVGFCDVQGQIARGFYR
jgi:hypothetical protein